MLLPNDPKEIGGIQILDRLGSGGAGIVYKGRDKDNEIVAVKVLHAEFANNQTVRKRLEREADAMRSVKGSRTVKVRRIEIDVVQPFIVMDFAEGENLANYIANHGVLKGQALNDFAMQLADAIRDIHKAKVIHRDLKPTNIIIGPDGLKVVDFGISIVSEVTGMTQTGILSGTASWLSPEQILGKDITEKTDIFNYGLVLGFAATGKHLFGEGKPEAVMFRILNTVPELNLLSRKMQTIIKELISKDPSKRPDTIRTLTLIKATSLSTNEIKSTKSNKVRGINGLPYSKLPVAISALGTLIILVIGLYFIPFKGIEENKVSLSTLEKEKKTEDTNVAIVLPKSTPIVTSSPLSSPSISAELVNPSPTPSQTKISEKINAIKCADGGTCKVGDIGPGGGQVFYVADEKKWWGQYMEASYEDLGYAFWCSRLEEIPGSQTRKAGIGQGKSNTESIINFCDNKSAANKASQFISESNGINYDDWFLPSKNELLALYKQKNRLAGFGLKDVGEIYWSSTEGFENLPGDAAINTFDDYCDPVSSCAWSVNFDGGNFRYDGPKNQSAYFVKPIRYFSNN
jgi:serine/threonine protein kinase